MATASNFLTLVNGVKTLVSSISAFTGTANEVVSTNGSGFIDATLLPPGVGVKTVQAVANGAIGAGDYVNIYDDTGTLTVQLADESTGIPANGFALAAILDTATGTINITGINDQLSGLTAGVVYWLDAAGAVTASPAFTEDGATQCLGPALSATELCAPDPCGYCIIDLA